jgi:hypothetical protein
MVPFTHQCSLFPSNDTHKVGATPSGVKAPTDGPPTDPVDNLGGVLQTVGKVAGTARRMAPSHLVALSALADQHTLAFWAGRYLAEEVCGVQAANTFEAKGHDITANVAWFVDFNGIGCIKHWRPRDTQVYLNTLEAQGRAPTTLISGAKYSRARQLFDASRSAERYRKVYYNS